jgi:hypothetical protein
MRLSGMSSSREIARSERPSEIRSQIVYRGFLAHDAESRASARQRHLHHKRLERFLMRGAGAQKPENIPRLFEQLTVGLRPLKRLPPWSAC